MSYCVCSDKDGDISIMTRTEREQMLAVLLDLKQEIPSFVIKTFEERKDAEDYVTKIKAANTLIEKL